MTTLLVLASASPRRRELLAAAGYRFTVDPAHTPELCPPHFTVAETALWNARTKALAVSRRHPHQPVIGVDTLVALDGRALGKPFDYNEARAMLLALGGREHEVFSGVWIAWGTRLRQAAFVERSTVRFRSVGPAVIDRYLSAIDPLDKAGGYAAQNDPFRLIAGIRGSRSNVIGLPMESLAAALARLAG